MVSFTVLLYIASDKKSAAILIFCFTYNVPFSPGCYGFLFITGFVQLDVTFSYFLYVWELTPEQGTGQGC